MRKRGGSPGEVQRQQLAALQEQIAISRTRLAALESIRPVSPELLNKIEQQRKALREAEEDLWNATVVDESSLEGGRVPQRPRVPVTDVGGPDARAGATASRALQGYQPQVAKVCGERINLGSANWFSTLQALINSASRTEPADKTLDLILRNHYTTRLRDRVPWNYFNGICRTTKNILLSEFLTIILFDAQYIRFNDAEDEQEDSTLVEQEVQAVAGPDYLFFAGPIPVSLVYIGFSKNPAARVAVLRTGNPEHLEVIHKVRIIGNKGEVKKAVHDLFRADCFARGWFYFDPVIQQTIQGTTAVRPKADGSAEFV